MHPHRCQLQLSKTGLRDLVVFLALSNRTLYDWVQAELAAGIADPPRICIRPIISEPETFTVALSSETVMGAWGVAKVLEADCGERVTAGDVYLVLLTRAARRDVLAMRGARGDDFDFIAGQFADLRDPGDEPRDENVIKKLNSLLVNVENDLVVYLPVRQENEAAKRAQLIAREAEQKRLTEAREAEIVQQTQERNRLAKLLAV